MTSNVVSRARALLALGLWVATGVRAQEPPIALTATQARNEAIERSAEIRLRRLEAQIQTAVFNRGLRAYFPTLGLSFSGSETIVLDAPDSSVVSVSADIEQPLYRGGRVRIQRALDRGGIDLARRTQLLTEEATGNAAWTAYQRAVVAQRELDIRTQTLERARERIVVTEAEAAFGRITELQLVQAQLDVAELELDVQESEQAVNRAMFELKRALSYPVDQELILVDDFDVSYNGLDMGEHAPLILDLMLRNNLELSVAKAEETQASQQLRLARRWWQPTVLATFSFGASGSEVPLQQPVFEAGVTVSFGAQELPSSISSTLSRPDDETRSRSSSISSDVLPQLTTRLGLRGAEIAFVRAREATVATQDGLIFTLFEQLDEYERQRETIELRRGRIALADQQLEILRRQEAFGQVTESQLIEAEISRNSAQIDLIRDVLVLIEIERAVEELLGLEPGDLTLIVERRS
ncbi:MAG: TolC family protein [Spirochaetales bacterium]|nr:TolC family protein [Spirochaetales bacterium]